MVSDFIDFVETKSIKFETMAPRILCEKYLIDGD